MTDHDFNHKWHVAINRFSVTTTEPWTQFHFMYEAKNAYDALRYLPYLFEKERTGTLPKVHQQCSRSEPEAIVENHLTCCLGVACATCPYLVAINAAEMPDEDKDRAKAWTCITHVIASGGDPAKEGYVLTEGDKMFWSNVYESLAAGAAEPKEPSDG